MGDLRDAGVYSARHRTQYRRGHTKHGCGGAPHHSGFTQFCIQYFLYGCINLYHRTIRLPADRIYLKMALPGLITLPRGAIHD